MNPETERRLAALIMEEANMMRQRAERDGVSAYLAKPVVKARPNRQFLGAMMRSVQHANRLVEVNDMWRQRSVEMEHKGKSNSNSHRSRNNGSEEQSPDRDHQSERGNRGKEASYSDASDCDDDGLKDEDIEKWLHSRVKRGRGVVGSRMDEPGPYCAGKPALGSESRLKEDWEDRIARPVAGPSQMPKSVAHAESDSGRERPKHRKSKKSSKGDSSDRISADMEERKQRQRSKEKRRKDKKKVRELETGKKRKRH